MEDKVRRHREEIDNWWLDNVYNPTGQCLDVWLIPNVTNIVIDYLKCMPYSHYNYYGYIDTLHRRQ
jgi:hypothetical protein